MKIDLTECFPQPEDPTKARGPLPKQQQFMDCVLDKLGPKYAAYFGGVGSGKSLILCITMLIQGIVEGGEYVIARQFMPELRRTTLKTFLDVCPKELLSAFRVADGEVHVKSTKGKDAIFYFVGLDEPDKLRSLNLSGFGIDEASQVSEESFLLLQGRLRNKGLRKGILVGNPAGHNWIYRYFIKQDMFNNPKEKEQYKLIVAPSTENVHLPDGYVESMLNTWSTERIQREILGSFDAFEGQVYSEFRRDTHVIKAFKIPDDWTKVVGADHGYRNPAAWIWAAVDGDENIYIYREFYQREWDIEEICNGKKDSKTGKRIKELPGVIQMSKGEKIESVFIDPSVNARRGNKGGSELDNYKEYLPENWNLTPGNNKKQPGIDKIKQYLKINPKNSKPKLFIFDTCVNLLDEIATYRYAEISPSQVGRRNEKEEPLKVNDHALDAFRYLVMSRPEPYQVDENWYDKHKLDYVSIPGAIHRELEEIHSPKDKDPFGDNI